MAVFFDSSLTAGLTRQVQVTGSAPVAPNVYTVWSEPIDGNTTISRSAELAGVENLYVLRFEYLSGTITFDWGGQTLHWEGEHAPLFTPGAVYEIFIQDGYASYKEYLVSSTPGITIDSALSPTSENPVQNKVITQALSDMMPLIYAGL